MMLTVQHTNKDLDEFGGTSGLTDDQMLLDAYSNAVIAATGMVSPSVVNIKSYRSSGSSWQGTAGGGSGFVVSPEGYIVTNSHVAENSTRLEVEMQDGDVLLADIVGLDPHTDLAVLKIYTGNIPYASFAGYDRLQVGQLAIALGNEIRLC
jgi:S1-C subfamily serine protease